MFQEPCFINPINRRVHQIRSRFRLRALHRFELRVRLRRQLEYPRELIRQRLDLLLDRSI